MLNLKFCRRFRFSENEGKSFWLLVLFTLNYDDEFIYVS